MSPTRNESTVLQRFECSSVIEMRNEIMFNFYPGLPHLCYKAKKYDLVLHSGVQIKSQLQLKVTA